MAPQAPPGTSPIGSAMSALGAGLYPRLTPDLTPDQAAQQTQIQQANAPLPTDTGQPGPAADPLTQQADALSKLIAAQLMRQQKPSFGDQLMSGFHSMAIAGMAPPGNAAEAVTADLARQQQAEQAGLNARLQMLKDIRERQFQQQQLQQGQQRIGLEARDVTTREAEQTTRQTQAETEKAREAAEEKEITAKTGLTAVEIDKINLENQQLRQNMQLYPKDLAEYQTRLLAIYHGNTNAEGYKSYMDQQQAEPFLGKAAQDRLTKAATEVAGAREAGARSQAALPAEISRAVTIQRLEAGNDPRLTNVPPARQKDVLDKVDTENKQYNDAKHAGDDMTAMIADAKAGNKVAYSFIPAEGALYLTSARGVRRINLNEMNAYGGGGSAMDNVRAFLGKAATGASIPPDILKDMESMNASIAKNVESAHQRRLQGIDETYGSTFAPKKTNDPMGIRP